MRKILIICIFGVLVLNNSNAQSTISGAGNIGHQAIPGSVWNTHYVGWNNNQIPLWFNTNNIVRARINGTLTESVNGINQNLDGFFGIGLNGFFANNAPISMLHLEGPNNTTPTQTGFGWRSWMRTGAFMRENSDAMYVGL